MLLGFVIATAAVALSAPLVGRLLGRNAGWVLGPALMALGVLLWLSAEGMPVDESYPWMPTAGIELAFRLDGLSLMFGLLVLIIGGIVLTYSARYLPPGSQSGYYGLMTLFALAMLGLVLANDVVVMFVMWETTTLCSFFLIARSGAAARAPALRTLLVTALGGLSLLAAVVVMAVQVGSTNLSVILASDAWADPAFAMPVAGLLALAAFTKSAQFPFQAWLPDAMAAATPVSAYLHAAAMVKAGIYLLMRFSGVLGDLPLWNYLLLSVGLTTGLIGAIAALRSHDLKELLAYSTVSQLGFLVAVIGIGTPTALVAASVHTVAHALFKSALFMLVGVINSQTGSRDIRLLAGARHHMPVTTVMVSVAALSMAGVPPLLGFVSKESVFAAFLDAPGGAWVGPLVGGIGVIIAILTFAYCGRIVFGTAGGTRISRNVHEAAATYLAPITLPVIAGVVLGLAPGLVNTLISDAGSAATATVIDAHLALWHGINPALFMSLGVIVIGSVMVLKRRPIDEFMAPRAFPFSALDVVDSTRKGIIRFGARVGDLTRSDSPTRHLAIAVLSLTAVAAVGVVTIGDLPAIVGEPTRPLDWVLVGLMLVGAIGAVLAHSRLAAIGIIGVVGFATTLWFFALGAPDVALTQLLVEILTVVVVVLLLRRLPIMFQRESRRRALGAGALALGAGTATTVAVLALTGRRDISPAGEYYLTEGPGESGGTNIVNTILVDFRAFDTLGELTVLGIAGVAVVVLLQARGLLPMRPATMAVADHSPLLDAHHNAVFGRALTRIIGPLIVIISLWFLLRGHDEPGGGFISALIGGAGFALIYLTSSADRDSRLRWPFLALIGSGIMVGTATGLAGFADGSFLRPLHLYVFDMHLTTALIFDVGVYLGVIGIVLASLRLLGSQEPDEATLPPRSYPVPVRNNRNGGDDS